MLGFQKQIANDYVRETDISHWKAIWIYINSLHDFLLIFDQVILFLEVIILFLLLFELVHVIILISSIQHQKLVPGSRHKKVQLKYYL